ncbi:ABC transporter substrate-binding protein [Methylobacterium oryzihabitans]|uniref:Transporter substrate-binding domain-containing protein n=1 Tax=Methylobacterium oryzihabitans TaxID=2499852 RepID=A0A3S3UCT0_9HYPH|nr:ABC transporter substrate-binding protein [Methylobacterium oryzihabitans]RVU21069.1 transporter substrate-binding domain-containing protein [Methylobacterium oryzihabitans]
MISRRSLLGHTAAGLAAAGLAASALPRPALAARETLRIGYLRGLASDAHLWTAERLGAFGREGLDVETIQFVSGLEAYQALVGGSLDLVTTGAVIANFPARGQGKAFLINAVEKASAQLWVQAGSGIASVADLKGKAVATTRGTTAHYFLYRLLQKAGLAETDLRLVHQPMNNAVASFIAGSVPALVTWIPLDLSIRKSAKGAVLLTDSGRYDDASVLNGWSARNAVFAERRDALRRFTAAWLTANDELVTRREDAVAALQRTKYPEFTAAEMVEQANAIALYGARDWAARYGDGFVTGILNRVTDFNVAVGGIANPLRAESYFDPSLFLDVAAKA